MGNLEVNFKTGLSENYKTLLQSGRTDEGTLYFCTDTLEMFKGSTQLGVNNIVITSVVPDPSSQGVGIYSSNNPNGVHPKKIYVVSDGAGGFGAYVLDEANATMVNLSPSTMSANSIVLPEKDANGEGGFVVNLGDVSAIGGLANGTDLSGKTVEEVLKAILLKRVPASYSAPSVAIANNSGTASGSHEYGTTITPKIKATFTKNDAGSLTGIQFYKDNVAVDSTLSGNVASYTEGSFTLTKTTSYKAKASYNAGAIKNDNLGDPSPTGSIGAGSKESSAYTYTPYYQGYFYGEIKGVVPAEGQSYVDAVKAAITPSNIRGMTKKNSAYAKGSIANKIFGKGAQAIVIACPSSNTGLTKVQNNSITQDVTKTFTKMNNTVNVPTADGTTTHPYNVWYYIPAEAYGSDETVDLTFTLG